MTLAWWWIPIAIALASIVGSRFVRDLSAWDFGSAFIRVAIMGAGFAAALGIVIGKLFF